MCKKQAKEEGNESDKSEEKGDEDANEEDEEEDLDQVLEKQQRRKRAATSHFEASLRRAEQVGEDCCNCRAQAAVAFQFAAIPWYHCLST